MSIETLLSRWRTDKETTPNLVVWRSTPRRPADLRSLPAELPDWLRQMLERQGIHYLYSHQAEAWEAALRGEHVVLATGTASGKTLAYNLPVLSALADDPQGRALYLFPTKALTQDQLSSLAGMLPAGLPAAVYDGDTPVGDRKAIREHARILFTNPDMLHTGILPHHTNWDDFLRGLRFVVIDEQHTYRGVFGSHVANVIRRLKRVAKFYGATPQFILTSATIGNPRELAERLIESPVTLVDTDGSGRGERNFLIYNPPVVDPALGLRKSATQESIRLAQEMRGENVQAVIFVRSRRGVEILLKQLQELAQPRTTRENGTGQEMVEGKDPVRGYRSGYLPSQRRQIEQGLRNGSVRMVVATNALELGIDIGGLEAALILGYPGTIASTWQQAGRAGRGDNPAAAVLVATANPLDQFLAHHPEYFFSRSPEQALVDPDHLLILLNHLRCAAFELPFLPGEGFGNLPVEKLGEFLDYLVESQELHVTNDKYYWMADAYPAAGVSLRSASPENVLLQVEGEKKPHLLGEVDLVSAYWMVHPRAIYLHEGVQYFVDELDLERNLARMRQVNVDYFTDPLRQTEISLVNDLTPISSNDGKPVEYSTGFGELLVTSRVTGFRKRAWLGGENLGEEPLDLPPSELQTTGYWLTLAAATVESLNRDGLWSNAPNDYGPDWNWLRDSIRKRDGCRCQVCGRPETERQHDVHHRVPFRSFKGESGRILLERANHPNNLVTLCTECHKKAELNVRMRSGLAGLATVLGQLAPLFLMCDPADLGVYHDPQAGFREGQPTVALFDQAPAGIGFSRRLYEMQAELLKGALELVQECECKDGCPSCVGPAGENGVGGRWETLAILKLITAGS